MSSGPFGTPAFVTTPRVTLLPLASCLPPLQLFKRIRRASSGAVLMESADQSARSGIRSLVLPEGMVRLTLHRERARYQALSPRGARLLDALAPGRAPGETLDRVFPEAPKDPALPDEDRLVGRSVLDAVRELAGLVADEPSAQSRWGWGPNDMHKEPIVLPPGVYGAFSYELVDCFEELPPRKADPLGDADAHLVLALDAVLYDHRQGEVRVITRSLGDDDDDHGARHEAYVTALAGESDCEELVPASVPEREAKEAAADVEDAHFIHSVERFLEHIRAGDIFQAVLSRGLEMRSGASSLDVYGALRRQNPSPYMFHIDLEEGALLGASPETCIKVESGDVEIRPIAGTAPRGLDAAGGVDPELDARLAVGLLLDRKEQAEHAMLVDLARNDVARVSVPGTRRVEEPLTIEKYSHVQHLVTRVRGRLRPGLDALHAYRASANMGTLTGAPKLRAMELIREEEPFSRGYYGGAVGYLLQNGNFDSCIVIRSLRHRNGYYWTRAGAGIVADSVPERELEETRHKARACQHAVSLAEAGGR